MQTANILLAIGGDPGNTVPKYGVTASEIAILCAIHGDGSVTDIEPGSTINRSSREEISRLRARYGRAKDSENNAIVDILFPGVAARAFETLQELDIDESFFKPIRRATAPVKADAEEPPASEPTQVDLASLTVPKLKGYAAEHGIDLGEATKKADILAAIENAEKGSTDVEGTDTEDAVADGDAGTEDGVGDMPDDQSIFS